ncbi:MAG: hypothetical protein ACXVXP_08390 [Mycobacteriaceae bacterium]
MSTDAATLTVGDVDLAPPQVFLAAHPNLPIPRGMSVGPIAGEISISAFVDTAEQVREWASAIGCDMGRSRYEGNTHYTACTFDPFHITITAIVAEDAVSA